LYGALLVASDQNYKDGSSARQQLALACLVARIHGIAADPLILQHQLALDEKSWPGFAVLKLAAKHVGLKARQELVQTERLRFTPLPAIAKLFDGSWAIVVAANDTHTRPEHHGGNQDR
jgi:subfamily B ATP-binding cassette protein HlyB/CyaB